MNPTGLSAQTKNVQQIPSKILVVDDNEKNRAIFKRRLAIYGHEIYSADGHTRAFEILEKRSVDVIFLDVMMPVVTGFDMLQMLKENPNYKNIPVIMISSDNDLERVVKCIENGAEDYLVKPINPTLLKARLMNSLEKKIAHDKEIAYLAQIKQGQKQIVAQEKMASIGNLVSAISQELKNPLNFVTNFSEVCGEICSELLDDITQNSHSFSDNLYQNITQKLKLFKDDIFKITEHSKKADKIIRFMLDQATTTAGELHPGHVNRVVEETVKLVVTSYNAKGKCLQFEVITDLDPKVTHMPIVVTGLTRAIFNLLDNSIYAVMHQTKDNYEPQVKISTKDFLDRVEVSIFDNGIGIAKNIVNKIFEPFFTTKPEGTGPGLGLSTVKEVIEKSHNGKIILESEENTFTLIKLILPKKLINNQQN